MVVIILVTGICGLISFAGFTLLSSGSNFYAVILHFVSAFLAFEIIKRKNRDIRYTLLNIILAFAVPVIGGFVALIFTMFSANRGRSGIAEEYAQHIDPEEYRELFSRDIKDFNPNPQQLYSLSDILHGNLPLVQKRKAIEALAQMESPQAVSILREALSMSSVEVRFFASSVIGKLEKRLEQRIAELETKDRDLGGMQVAVITELAQSYFDFVFFSLVEGARRDEYLALALGYALDAYTLEESDGMLSLIGRIFLVNGNVAEAIVVFNKFVENNPNDMRGRLWRAEAYLKNRDYALVGEDAKEALEMGKVPQAIENAVMFWAGGVEL